MITVFIVIIVLYIAFLLFMWFNRPSSNHKEYRTTKGGDVHNVAPPCIKANDLSKRKFIFNGNIIDSTDYEIFIVSGNSMKFAGICDGDAVFVNRLYGRDKFTITNSPVLIFEIDRMIESNCDCKVPVEFKLRKFIDYIKGCSSFSDWFEELKSKNTHPELIENKEMLEQKFNKCVEIYRQYNPNCDDFLLILSSTFNVEQDIISYSFHPIKFLYGEIKYIVAAENLYK